MGLLFAGSRRVRLLSVRFLLEGRPGAGKTTVARRLAERLSKEGAHLRGFFTEELSVSLGRRVGFAVETVDGRRGVLAHVRLPGPPRVGRYGVDLEAFARLALPALTAVGSGDLVLIDELGKMELASDSFRTRSRGALRATCTVATSMTSFSSPVHGRAQAPSGPGDDRSDEDEPRRVARAGRRGHLQATSLTAL